MVFQVYTAIQGPEFVRELSGRAPDGFAIIDRELMKVLIVDDSEIMREHLTDALSGYAQIEIVGEAGDGCQALESFRKLAPDVVILDIRMPDGSGIDVLEQLKQDAAPPVVIMFTNYPFPQYRDKCRQAGAEFFFDKSSESHKVIETLESLAGRYESQGRDSAPGNGSA